MSYGPYPVEVRPGIDGYTARCTTLSGCEARGSSVDEALDKLKEHIRYYLESCPCQEVPSSTITLDVKTLQG